jgi:hypothetical protein
MSNPFMTEDSAEEEQEEYDTSGLYSLMNVYENSAQGPENFYDSLAPGEFQNLSEDQIQSAAETGYWQSMLSPEQQEDVVASATGLVPNLDFDVARTELEPGDYYLGEPVMSQYPSFYDFLTGAGWDPVGAETLAQTYGEDPRIQNWMLQSFSPEGLPQSIAEIDPKAMSSLYDIISGETAGSEESWLYDDAYIAKVDQQIADLTARANAGQGWTLNLLSELNDLQADKQFAQDNFGQPRPDSPYAWASGFETPPDLEGEIAPWVPEGGEYNPFDIAGLGPFAPGYVLGDKYGYEQGIDILGSDPWGMDWRLPPPISVSIPEMTEEEQGVFFAADRFFSSLNKAVKDGGFVNPYTDQLDFQAYWADLQSKDPEMYDRLFNLYNLHGANWDTYADTYYKNAQNALMEFTEGPEYGEQAAERIRSILPLVASIAPAIGMDPNSMYQELVRAAEAAEDGQPYDIGWVADASRNITLDPDQGLSQTGLESLLDFLPDDLKGQVKTLIDDYDVDLDDEEDLELPPPKGEGKILEDELDYDLNSGQGVSDGASVAEVYGTQRAEGFSSEQINALGNVVKGNVERGLGSGSASGLSTVEVPNFVMNASRNDGFANPLNDWLSLDETQKENVIGWANGQGIDTTQTTSVFKPNADISMQTSGGDVEFYIPKWLAKSIQYGESVGLGNVPDIDPSDALSWWSSIGAEGRNAAQLKYGAAQGGDSTDFIVHQRIKDGSTQQASFAFDSDGDIYAEWDDTSPITSGVEYGNPKASIAETAMWLLSQNPDLDPGNQEYWGNNPRRTGLANLAAYDPTAYIGNTIRQSGELWSGVDETSGYVNPGVSGAGALMGGADFTDGEYSAVGSLDNAYRPLYHSYEAQFNLGRPDIIAMRHLIPNAPGSEWYHQDKWEVMDRLGTRYIQPDSPNYSDDPSMGYVINDLNFGNYLVDPETNQLVSYTGALLNDQERDVFLSEFDEWLRGQDVPGGKYEGASTGVLWPMEEDELYTGRAQEFGNELTHLDRESDLRLGVAPNMANANVQNMGGDGFFFQVEGDQIGQWNLVDINGNEIESPKTLADVKSDKVYFDPEDFFKDQFGEEYEMSDASRIGFWRFMNEVLPVYDQYSTWWDAQYSGAQPVETFNSWKNNPINLSTKPSQGSYDDNSAYFNALKIWETDMSDKYNLYVGSQNDYAQDPVLTGYLNTNFAEGGLVSLGYANGGPVSAGISALSNEAMMSVEPEMPQMPQINNDLETMLSGDPILAEAAQALLGNHPNPDAAINQAVQMYGEEILQLLMEAISGGRRTSGPGDGLSDSIPAMIDGEQPAKLSSGEFVVPSDVVSHLGNGDNESGAGQLHEMMNRVRQQRTGMPSSPPAINPNEVLPA